MDEQGLSNFSFSSGVYYGKRKKPLYTIVNADGTQRSSSSSSGPDYNTKKPSQKFLDVDLENPLYGCCVQDGIFESDLLLAANAAAENNVALPATLAEKIAERVIDDRKKVQTPYAAPWNGIVSLSLTFEEWNPGQQIKTRVYLASGVLIDDGFVLTSAHNLYNLHDNSFVNNISVFPGRDGQ